MKRHEIINKLIQENGYSSYLEIGLGSGKNFESVKCENKWGVDPHRLIPAGSLSNGFKGDSDDFFLEPDLVDSYLKFGLIFIDGLHTSEQVEKDIINSWNALEKGGVIILHDIYPKTKESQLVPKVSSPWKGDVWRAFVGFMKTYPKIEAYTTLDDSGLGFIWKSNHRPKLGFIDIESTYEEFDKNRKTLLNIR